LRVRVGETCMIQLVCFDLGGVLVRVRESLAAACAAAEVAVPKSVADPGHARVFSSSFSALGQQAATGQIGMEDFFVETGRLTGLSLSDLKRVSRAWLAGSQPGVAELIDELADGEALTACLSNTHEHHWRVLTDADATEYAWVRRLDYRFASHLIGHIKPDARIYRHVEDETGINGGQILFFDDREENVAAARDLGWQATQIVAADEPVSQIRARLKSAGVIP